MPYGLGAGGALGLALETAAAPGTFVAPAVWVPILDESLAYTETRYYSPAIRQQTIANDVRQGYYNIAGDVHFEVDTRYLAYFLHGSRWSVTKTGAGPYSYKFVPASSATTPSTNRTLSLGVIRNGQGFGYAGCNVTQFVLTINGGILECTCSILGLSESSQSLTPTFAPPPRILSAPSHALYLNDNAVASGALTPGTANLNFNGFTLTVNDNGAVQTRINALRSAAYISYGITDLTIASELDFLDRAEYNKFVASSRKNLQLQSLGTTTGVSAANDTLTFNAYDLVYDTYGVTLGNWANLIMAQTTFRGVASGGTNPPADLTIATDANIVVA